MFAVSFVPQTTSCRLHCGLRSHVASLRHRHHHHHHHNHQPLTSLSLSSQICSLRKPIVMAARGPAPEDIAMRGDKLILRGLKFHGFHGAIPEERTLGQMFMLDIDAWMSLKKAGESDNLADTISYVDIYSVAKEIVEGSPKNLLEAVAELIASNTLKAFDPITAVRVKLWKPNVALIQGHIDYLGVEIIRYRKSDDAQI